MEAVATPQDRRTTRRRSSQWPFADLKSQRHRLEQTAPPPCLCYLYPRLIRPKAWYPQYAAVLAAATRVARGISGEDIMCGLTHNISLRPKCAHRWQDQPQDESRMATPCPSFDIACVEEPAHSRSAMLTSADHRRPPTTPPPRELRGRMSPAPCHRPESRRPAAVAPPQSHLRYTPYPQVTADVDIPQREQTGLTHTWRTACTLPDRGSPSDASAAACPGWSAPPRSCPSSLFSVSSGPTTVHTYNGQGILVALRDAAG
jgi:hypothetical protein